MRSSTGCMRGCRITGILLLAVVSGNSLALGQGVNLRGVSAVNNSMGGAATACPIDSAGAIHWNPASITGLPSSDISFGLELILPSTTLASSVGPLHGSDSGEAGVVPVPDMALVSKSPDSPWTWGVGVYGIGGSAVNYSADPTNPILSPQPPVGHGLGRTSANVDVLQIAPTIAYQLTDHWSVGAAPTLTMARIFASPLFLGPQDANDAWSSGVGTRYVWGGGFQVGTYYTTDSCWNFGASIKSPQWMEPFRFKSEDALGLPTNVDFLLNYPLIASIGTAYTGFEKWTIACDLRYFDYANTTGFRHLGFAADGAAQGFNWNSVMAVALGVQRQVNDRCSVRVGYCFNENPIDSAAAAYNVASPLIVQHALSTGGSFTFGDNWIASLTYMHCFANSVTGPIVTPAGTIPGSSVTSTASADSLTAGITKRF